MGNDIRDPTGMNDEEFVWSFRFIRPSSAKTRQDWRVTRVTLMWLLKIKNTFHTAGINSFSMYGYLTQPVDGIRVKATIKSPKILFKCSWMSRQARHPESRWAVIIWICVWPNTGGKYYHVWCNVVLDSVGGLGGRGLCPTDSIGFNNSWTTQRRVPEP